MAQPEIRTLDPLELWNRPRAGKLAGWVSTVVVVGCALTVAIAGLGARVLWRVDGRRLGTGEGWFCNSLAVAIAIMLIATYLPASKMSRMVRVAVALPIVHVVAMVIAWAAFTLLEPKLKTLHQTVPLVDSMPISAGVLVFGGASLGVAWLAARRRRGERMHAFVMVALAHLLVLGLWLPIAARLVVDNHDTYVGFVGDHYWTKNGMLEWMDGRTLQLTATLRAVVLLPGFAVASLFTLIAIRRPRWLRALRTPLLVVLPVLALGAVLARVKAPNASLIIYDNFTHLVFAAAFIAITAIAGLAIVTWVRIRRAQHTGTVLTEESGEVVGCLEIQSWLRGPRSLVRSFTLLLPTGEVPIEGARLVATLPLITTVLRNGESAVVLQSGDRVHVAGLVARQDGDGPFRAMSTLVPGPGGLVVTPDGEHPGGFANAAMALWRPSIAYLLILTAVALPALVAALNPPTL